MAVEKVKKGFTKHQLILAQIDLFYSGNQCESLWNGEGRLYFHRYTLLAWASNVQNSIPMPI